MQSVRLPIGSYNQSSRAPSRLVNVYAQQTIGKGPVELLGCPGIASFATLGVGPGRGLFVMRGVLYAVSGTTLYRIDEFGSESVLGTIPGSTKCTFAGNGTEIVVGPQKYIYSGGSVAAITDGDLPSVLGFGYVDGYMLYAESGSGRWGCSQLYSGATYDGLDFASTEGYPDDLVCPPIVDHRQVILLGAESGEIWWNAAAGGAGFPFERLAGGFLELGALARLGYAKQDNSVWWLANDRTIRRLTSQTPVRVSQHGVEERISNYSRVDDCEAFPLAWNGHLWIVFRFPAAGACWTFDVNTNEFHERSSFGGSTWNIVDSANCYGKVFVQHADTGAIGYLSDAVYSEFGTTMRREWTYPQVYDTNREVTHSQLELVMKTGTAPINVTPHVGLDISDDGGNTWLTLPPREMGRVGQYQHVVRWNRLGRARDRVYRCWVDDAAVPVCVTDTTLRIE